MDRSRYYFLARARFAADQNRKLSISNQLNQSTDLLDTRVTADDPVPPDAFRFVVVEELTHALPTAREERIPCLEERLVSRQGAEPGYFRASR